MKSISFSITRVNSLRRAAGRAREIRDKRSGPWPDGWFASTYDANDLISVFDTLLLKPGFALRAYEFRQDLGGDGIIWAVPADASKPPPDRDSGLFGGLSHPPKPLGAVPLMLAIEGDRSPWSFLSASILRREAAEFGAV